MSEKPYLEELTELFDKSSDDLSPGEIQVMKWPFMLTTQDCAIAFWLDRLAKALDERFAHQDKAFLIAPRKNEQQEPCLIFYCYRPAPKVMIRENHAIATMV